MNYWPGTKILKSRGNAFDWKNGEHSKLARDPQIRASNNARLQMAGAASDPKRTFTIYSKARQSK